MTNICVGKIVNTFGIKGELKLASEFDMPERVFTPGNMIIINNVNHQITNARFHKEHYLYLKSAQ